MNFSLPGTGNPFTSSIQPPPESHELTIAPRSQAQSGAAASAKTVDAAPAGERPTAPPPKKTAAQLAMLQHLEGTRKNAENLKRKIGSVEANMAHLHAMLGHILSEARINGAITAEEERQAVRGLEELLQHTPELKKALQEVIDSTDGLAGLRTGESWADWTKRQGAEWGSWAKSGVNPRVAGAVALGLGAMAAKNGAWYLPSLISSKGIPFNATKQMAALFFKRWVTANGAAGAAEYPASVISQKMFKATGNSMNQFLAVLQLGDMVSAFAALKITGSHVSAYEGMGMASVALASLVRTGTLSKVWNHFGKQTPYEVTPIALASLSDPATATASDADNATDPERQRPNQPLSKVELQGIDELLRVAPTETWQSHMNELNSLMGELDALQQAGPVPAGTSAAAMEAGAAGQAQQAPATPEIGAMTEMVERVHAALGKPAFAAYRNALSQVGSNDAEAVNGNQLDQLRGHLEEIKSDLGNKAGMDGKTIGFAIAMGVAYLGPLLLANAGQQSGSAVLAHPLTRGALNIMGSVAAQTVANLGHLAWPDKETDSQLIKNIKSVGLSIGLTPTEFIPLVLGLLFTDKAKDMAEQTGASEPWPRNGIIRLGQELLRPLYSTGATHVITGTPVSRDDVVGLLIQVAGTGLAVGLDHMKANKK